MPHTRPLCCVCADLHSQRGCQVPVLQRSWPQQHRWWRQCSRPGGGAVSQQQEARCAGPSQPCGAGGDRAACQSEYVGQVGGVVRRVQLGTFVVVCLCAEVGFNLHNFVVKLQIEVCAPRTRACWPHGSLPAATMRTHEQHMAHVVIRVSVWPYVPLRALAVTSGAVGGDAWQAGDAQGAGGGGAQRLVLYDHNSTDT